MKWISPDPRLADIPVSERVDQREGARRTDWYMPSTVQIEVEIPDDLRLRAERLSGRTG